MSLLATAIITGDVMYDLLSAELRKTNEASLHKLRTTGFIPGVLFAKDMDSVPLTIKESDLKKIIRHGVKVFEVQLEGQGKFLVNLEGLQKDPVTRKVIHASFHKLNKNQATHVMVPIKLVGISPGTKEGGVVRQLIDEVMITGLPHKIPEFIEVNINTLELNAHYNVSDINIGEGLSFNEADLEKGIVNCHVPKVIEEPVVDETEVAAEADEATTETSGTVEETTTPVEEKKVA